MVSYTFLHIILCGMALVGKNRSVAVTMKGSWYFASIQAALFLLTKAMFFRPWKCIVVAAHVTTCVSVSTVS